MKGIGCLHLMCHISLDSDGSEMSDIWLSNNEAFKTAQAPTTSYKRSGIYHINKTMCI